MCSTLVNAIKFAKDFSTFEFKGAEKNVYPHRYEWTTNAKIPLSELLGAVAFGDFHLSESVEKLAFISTMATRANEWHGGTWEEKNDMYHCFQREKHGTATPEEIARNSKARLLFETAVKEYEPDGKKYVIRRGDFYMETYGLRTARRTMALSKARTWSKFVAEAHARNWEGWHVEELTVSE